jgi:hypothetical protein
VLRTRLVPKRVGIPGAWFGRELTPGVRGFVVGSVMFLGVAPPARNIWTNRRSPVVFGRIVQRADGGSDLRLGVYRQGFPLRAFEDAPAQAFFDAWLLGTALSSGPTSEP